MSDQMGREATTLPHRYVEAKVPLLFLIVFYPVFKNVVVPGRQFCKSFLLKSSVKSYSQESKAIDIDCVLLIFSNFNR